MQVQNVCKVCPVCKAGIAEDKVRSHPLHSTSFFSGPCNGGSQCCTWHPRLMKAGKLNSRKAGCTLHQVVPIYGRGGAQEDPRGKQRAASKEHHQDSNVPRRPAGQRLVPTDVRLCSWLQGALSLLLSPTLIACLDSAEGHSCTAYRERKYAAWVGHHTHAAWSQQ